MAARVYCIKRRSLLVLFHCRSKRHSKCWPTNGRLPTQCRLKSSDNHLVLSQLYCSQLCLYDEFDDVLECTTTFASPIVILGDINIHHGVLTNLNTIKFFSSLESHNLVQHVAGRHTPTATRSTYSSHVLMSELRC